MMDWLNANQGFALALLTALYTIATMVLVGASIRSNRLHAKNIRTIITLEKLRNRPVVLLKFVVTSHTFVSVVLVNTGKSTAFDIEVSIDPVPRRTSSISDRPKVSFLHDKTLSLPPEAELRSLVTSVKDLKDQSSELTYEGQVVYKNSEGEEYSEPFRVDLRDQLDGVHIKRKTTHHIAERLEKIQKELKLFVQNQRTPLIRVIREDDYKEQQRQKQEQIRKRLEQIEEQEKKVETTEDNA